MLKQMAIIDFTNVYSRVRGGDEAGGRFEVVRLALCQTHAKDDEIPVR